MRVENKNTPNPAEALADEVASYALKKGEAWRLGEGAEIMDALNVFKIERPKTVSAEDVRNVPTEDEMCKVRPGVFLRSNLMTALDEFLEHARKEMFPMLKGSVMSLIIASDEPDPKLCLELGAAILFDKPLIVLVPPGKHVPANLKRVASVIVEGDFNNPRTKEKLARALRAVVANDTRGR